MATNPSDSTARQGGAYNPVTHFILLPVFLINLIFTIVVAVRAPEHHVLHLWLAVVALCLLLLTANQRMYALKVQDRVIRLEERLRISALVSPAAAYKLTTPQLIGLRFASDAELPALVARTLNENLDLKHIKDSVMDWRPDRERV